MKLATYRPKSALGLATSRVGAVATFGEAVQLVDLQRAYATLLRDDGDPRADEVARARLPAQMKLLLEGGARSLQAARDALQYIGAALRSNEGSALAALAAAGVLYPLGSVSLQAPLPRPGKIIGVGANYREHVEEGRATGALNRIPPYPPAFLKMPSAVIGPDEPIRYPSFGNELDYEVELAMIIGAHCHDVSVEVALDVVAGFTIVNDLGLRDVIFEEREIGVVTSGKNFPTSCPLGPVIVTPDEIGDPYKLKMECRVNGAVRSSGVSDGMLFPFEEMIAHISQDETLMPGEFIGSGTVGKGCGLELGWYLEDNDEIELEVEKIGILKNRVERQQALDI